LAGLLLALVPAYPKSGSHSAIQSSRKSSVTTEKKVHVREYTRKDGKVVPAHDRAAPRTGDQTRTGTQKKSLTPSSAAVHRAPAPSVKRDPKTGRIARSVTAKRRFERSHPCPAPGAHRIGTCPGYVIDHKRPLACGGADAPENMQWQTVAEAKAKDRWERQGCR